MEARNSEIHFNNTQLNSGIQFFINALFFHVIRDRNIALYEEHGMVAGAQKRFRYT